MLVCFVQLVCYSLLLVWLCSLWYDEDISAFSPRKDEIVFIDGEDLHSRGDVTELARKGWLFRRELVMLGS